MQLTFRCPSCSRDHRCHIDKTTPALQCFECNWSRPITELIEEDAELAKCLVCHCDDLWRQKDFPPKLGLMMVGLGALFSTIAWMMYQPVIAIAILMAFALCDLLLYVFLKDVLACYRCGARHRVSKIDDDHPGFDLETAERYRQEEIRLNSASHETP